MSQVDPTNQATAISTITAAATGPAIPILSIRSAHIFGSGLREYATIPGVTSAVPQVTGRVPNGSGNSGDCNIYRYGGGHWSSYSDLVNKVRVAFGDTIRPGATGQIDLNRARGMNIRPGVNGAGVITAGGANMTAHGSGN